MNERWQWVESGHDFAPRTRHIAPMIDTRNGTARLLDFLPGETLPSASLRELTGDNAKARVGTFASGLERRLADAWIIPASDLTCGQCRMLVGQRLGLRWLARPAAMFAATYPRAECDLYPGDLTVISLVVWRDLAAFAPEATCLMLAGDYGWLRSEANEDQWAGSILKRAVRALDEITEARTSATGASAVIAIGNWSC